MKKAILPLLIVFCSLSFLAGCSSKKEVHPRLKKLVDIRSIHIWSEHSDASSPEKSIDDKEKIEQVISFIKDVEYKSISSADRDNDGSSDYWKFRLSFDGWRDEIHYFENHAFLGKST